MKVTIRLEKGDFSVYIPKKDLELAVVETDPNYVFGGTYKLENGLILSIPPKEEMPRLPLTLNAKKV